MKPVAMNPIKTVYFAASIALAAGTGYVAQSPRFIEEVATVGAEFQLPLERIATNSALPRALADGSRSVSMPSAAIRAKSAHLATSKNGLHQQDPQHKPPRLIPGYRRSVTGAEYWT
jgi:hypothetical protein